MNPVWNKKMLSGCAGVLIVAAVACASVMAQQSKLRKKHVQIAEPLTIYFIDVEGGQSTLFITPEHQSLLVDTGWPDNEGRDAERIAAVAKMEDLDHIDFVLLTHYHEDHTGGVPQLVAKIPVVEFIDHGPLREPNDAATAKVYAAYQNLLAQSHAKHILATVGMTLPIEGLTATIVSADGNLLTTPMPGAAGAGEPNPYCKDSEQRPADQTENARSVGMVMQFGKFRLVDLGDLTWDKEMQMMCPNNNIGKVDLYVVSHHGWDHSGSPAFVDAIAPRVAIMDNGENKGGSPGPWETIEKSPRLKQLWQLHYSAEGGETHNVPELYIANPQGTDQGYYLKVSAYPDGRMVVYSERTQKTTVYPAP